MAEPEEGQPGKPGEAPIGQQGGRGGEGGRGGAGVPEGGGGRGGEGGRGARGRQGPAGPKGNAGREGLPPLWKMLLTIWIVVFTLVVSWGIAQNASARQALCDQRHDLDERIERTQLLLDETPGPTIFGFPRTLIQETLERDQTTRRNLDGLDNHWYLLSC